ncbi:MAG: hypothetical protein IJU55_05815 [Selenomonadaceae bacterium]|nr:hypothetical protein [Selenomonadaceae bacterium]
MAKLYYDEKNFREVENIKFYLMPGPNIFVKSRSEPLCPVPKIITGNRPADGGNLILSEDEKNFFVKKYPQDKKFIKRLIGGEEFLHNKKRYCLWLVDATPEQIKNNKFIYERVKKCKEDRLNGAADRKKLADTPHLFRETFVPEKFIAIPKTSSEKRFYIPMDFLDKNFICTDSLLIIPDAEIWHFGILTSSVHMAWMRLVAGRLKSDYRYSAKIVYNNFVWVRMEFIQYAELILAAEKILKVRKNYPDASFADLYDEITMPKDLRDAHKNLDEIVLDIYGFSKKMTDEEIALEMLDNYRRVCEIKNC